MNAKVKKWGNSLGVVIPAEIAKKIELKNGDIVDMDIVKKDRRSAFGAYKGIGGFKRDELELDREFE